MDNRYLKINNDIKITRNNKITGYPLIMVIKRDHKSSLKKLKKNESITCPYVL